MKSNIIKILVGSSALLGVGLSTSAYNLQDPAPPAVATPAGLNTGPDTVASPWYPTPSGTQGVPVSIGQELFASGGDITVTFLGPTGAFDDEQLFVAQPSTPFGLFMDNHSTANGTTFDLGIYAAGTEIEFGLYDFSSGNTWFDGPGSRNSDGDVHAYMVNNYEGLAGTTYVGFEDEPGSLPADFNYIDEVYAFTGVSAIVIQTGSLSVSINPQAAITDGAQWQVDGGTLQNSGATVGNLSAGSHTVGFSTLIGWTTPTNQTVSITNGTLTEATGTYAQQPAITNPVPGSILTSSSVTFEWSSGTDVTNYFLYVGSDVGDNDIYGQSQGLNLSVTVASIPVDGSTLYVRLYWATASSGWQYTDYTYTSAVAAADGLILVTNGLGTIQHSSWPDSLVIGNKYTVKAMPDAGYLFQSWVGGSSTPYSVLSTSASYTFTMESGLLLEANFFPNQFLTAHGAYYGLFAPAHGARDQTNSGSFNFNLTTTGGMSGKLNLGSQTVPLSGKFEPDGSAQIITRRPGQSTLTTSLQLDVTNETVSGTVTDGAFVAQLTGYQNIFTSHLTAPYVGRYTFAIPGSANPAIGPFGTSYGTVTVGPTGTVTFAGSLADGTPFSQSSLVSLWGQWPLYVNLYGGKGSLWGWNLFTNLTIGSAPTLSWINATNSCKTAVCHSGFTNQAVTLTGALYQPIETLPFDLTATLEGGCLSCTITNGVTISTSDKIALTNSLDETNKLKLAITKSTGVISGSFANPANPKQTIKINGVILQGQTNAQGYFLGTNQSGVFLLQSP